MTSNSNPLGFWWHTMTEEFITNIHMLWVRHPLMDIHSLSVRYVLPKVIIYYKKHLHNNSSNWIIAMGELPVMCMQHRKNLQVAKNWKGLLQRAVVLSFCKPDSISLYISPIGRSTVLSTLTSPFKIFLSLLI